MSGAVTRWMVVSGLVLTALAFAAMSHGRLQEPVAVASAAAPNRDAHSTVMVLRLNGEPIEGDPVGRRGSPGSAIEVSYYESSVLTAREAGSGMATGRRQYQPILIRKRIDKASPLLMRGMTQNQVGEVEFRFYRPNASTGASEHFYTVRLQNASISSIRVIQEAGAEPVEEIAFLFQTITWIDPINRVEHEDSLDDKR